MFPLALTVWLSVVALDSLVAVSAVGSVVVLVAALVAD